MYDYPPAGEYNSDLAYQLQAELARQLAEGYASRDGDVPETLTDMDGLYRLAVLTAGDTHPAADVVRRPAADLQLLLVQFIAVWQERLTAHRKTLTQGSPHEHYLAWPERHTFYGALDALREPLSSIARQLAAISGDRLGPPDSGY